MTYYSAIVKDQIDNDIESIKRFKYGNLFYPDAIVQGKKSLAINYRIYSAYKVEYELIYFNELEGSERTISLEEVDQLFILTPEEYIDYLKNELRSDKSGIDKDGHWYVLEGIYGWAEFNDGQYVVVSSYGFMRPDDTLNELCHEQVTNHSKDKKLLNRITGVWHVIE